jgi:hypothetical protein
MTLPILTGPFRYLIGVDKVPLCNPGDIVEVPYQTVGETCYGNLRDEQDRYENLAEANARGPFRPYLAGDDITGEYGEFTPDPAGPGFINNINAQIAWIKKRSGNAVRMELDNPDSKGLSLDAVVSAHDLAWKAGLRTIGKNPLLVSDPARYLSHPSIDLAVVERGDGIGSDAMEELRKQIGQPLLAVRFVACNNEDGDGIEWARAVAVEIYTKAYRNMGVTYSGNGEYTSWKDILIPTS